MAEMQQGYQEDVDGEETLEQWVAYFIGQSLDTAHNWKVEEVLMALPEIVQYVLALPDIQDKHNFLLHLLPKSHAAEFASELSARNRRAKAAAKARAQQRRGSLGSAAGGTSHETQGKEQAGLQGNVPAKKGAHYYDTIGHMKAHAARRDSRQENGPALFNERPPLQRAMTIKGLGDAEIDAQRDRWRQNTNNRIKKFVKETKQFGLVFEPYCFICSAELARLAASGDDFKTAICRYCREPLLKRRNQRTGAIGNVFAGLVHRKFVDGEWKLIEQHSGQESTTNKPKALVPSKPKARPLFPKATERIPAASSNRRDDQGDSSSGSEDDAMSDANLRRMRRKTTKMTKHTNTSRVHLGARQLARETETALRLQEEEDARKTKADGIPRMKTALHDQVAAYKDLLAQNVPRRSSLESRTPSPRPDRKDIVVVPQPRRVSLAESHSLPSSAPSSPDLLPDDFYGAPHHLAASTSYSLSQPPGAEELRRRTLTFKDFMNAYRTLARPPQPPSVSSHDSHSVTPTSTSPSSRRASLSPSEHVSRLDDAAPDGLPEAPRRRVPTLTPRAPASPYSHVRARYMGGLRSPERWRRGRVSSASSDHSRARGGARVGSVISSQDWAETDARVKRYVREQETRVTLSTATASMQGDELLMQEARERADASALQEALRARHRSASVQHDAMQEARERGGANKHAQKDVVGANEIAQKDVVGARNRSEVVQQDVAQTGALRGGSAGGARRGISFDGEQQALAVEGVGLGIKPDVGVGGNTSSSDMAKGGDASSSPWGGGGGARLFGGGQVYDLKEESSELRGELSELREGSSELREGSSEQLGEAADLGYQWVSLPEEEREWSNESGAAQGGGEEAGANGHAVDADQDGGDGAEGVDGAAVAGGADASLTDAQQDATSPTKSNVHLSFANAEQELEDLANRGQAEGFDASSVLQTPFVGLKAQSVKDFDPLQLVQGLASSFPQAQPWHSSQQRPRLVDRHSLKLWGTGDVNYPPEGMYSRITEQDVVPEILSVLYQPKTDKVTFLRIGRSNGIEVLWHTLWGKCMTRDIALLANKNGKRKFCELTCPQGSGLDGGVGWKIVISSSVVNLVSKMVRLARYRMLSQEEAPDDVGQEVAFEYKNGGFCGISFRVDAEPLLGTDRGEAIVHMNERKEHGQDGEVPLMVAADSLPILQAHIMGLESEESWSKYFEEDASPLERRVGVVFGENKALSADKDVQYAMSQVVPRRVPLKGSQTGKANTQRVLLVSRQTGEKVVADAGARVYWETKRCSPRDSWRQRGTKTPRTPRTPLNSSWPKKPPK